LPEIVQLGIVLLGIKRAGGAPLIDLGADQVRPRETSHDLSFEQAPQEGEVEDCGAVLLGQRLKSWCSCQQPLHAHRLAPSVHWSRDLPLTLRRGQFLSTLRELAVPNRAVG